jgi:DNA repair protein RadC
MKDLSSMSRAELVRELIATCPANMLSDDLSLYGAACAVPCTSPCDSVVCRKLFVAKEILMRDLQERMKSSSALNSPQAVRDWLRLHCANLEHEVFIVLHLDAQNRVISVDELFRGTLTQTSVYPREVVKAALRVNAAAVIFAHNHPSGIAEPSRADEALTQSLKHALSLVDVKVLDHFVLGGSRLASFAERGLL